MKPIRPHIAVYVEDPTPSDSNDARDFWMTNAPSQDLPIFRFQFNN